MSQQSLICERLEGCQAQASRRVETRAEGHARVQRQDHVAGLLAVAAPGGPDDHPLPDPQNWEVALPGLGPVFLADQARLQLADRPQAEGLEMAQRRARVADRGLDARRVAAGQVGPDDGWLGRIHDRAEPFVG